MKTDAIAIPQTEPVRVTRVRDLLPGHSAYIVPWSFNKETEMVKLNYVAYQTRGGTATIKIKCIIPKELYHVWPAKDPCAEPVDTQTEYIPAAYPQKKCLVKFTRDTEKSFYVWTDLSRYELEQIPGVGQACRYASGDFHIYVDARYDLDEVQAEIERRAIIEEHYR